MALNDVVMGLIETATHSEIRNLDLVILTDQNISSSEIEMDKIVGSEIVHGTCDLCADRYEGSFYDLLITRGIPINHTLVAL